MEKNNTRSCVNHNHGANVEDEGLKENTPLTTKMFTKEMTTLGQAQ